MSRSRAATALGDMSIPRGMGDASLALRSLIMRSRSNTCSGVMFTTRDLLQALDIDDVLWSAGGKLQRDQAGLRDDPQRAFGCADTSERNACPYLPDGFEGTFAAASSADVRATNSVNRSTAGA